jgi:hypothetical protein
MRCLNCRTDNRAGRKFCAQCGAALKPVCPSCGAENEPAEKYCGECGAKLGSGRATAASPNPAANNLAQSPSAYTPKLLANKILQSKAAPEGERKQVTVLFADVKGSMEMAERLRPEKGLNLQVRVGANSGEVVVRSIETGQYAEYTPIGHSTSLASRLQTLASPGSITISGGLRKLVERDFTLKALGPARIKGTSPPVNVYEVTAVSKPQTWPHRGFTRPGLATLAFSCSMA